MERADAVGGGKGAATRAAPEPRPARGWDRAFLLLRPAALVVFVAAAVFYVSFSWRWKLMVDSPVMHYVVFLMHHGFRPYLDISDNNMPGAYFIEAVAMRVFGPGDAGWRLYEYFLLAAMVACTVPLARAAGWRRADGVCTPGDWVAGVFSAGMFLALHASEGPQYAGERELGVTVLILLAYALLFCAVRRRTPALVFAVGLAGGLAAAIKPTYLPFTIALLLLAGLVLWRRGVAPWLYLAWGLAGLVAVGAGCLFFFVHFHVLRGFVFILTRVLPTYAGFAAPTWGTLLRSAAPRAVLGMAALTLPVAVLNRGRLGAWTWEHGALALGAALALGSFLAQRKGFFHHRYAFLTLLFLLMGAELFAALRGAGVARVLAAVVLVYAFVGFVPRMLRTGARVPGQTQFYLSLRADLQTLGGPAVLQDKVQCFDLVYGCLNALYHEGIVENTGFTGDLLFFSPNPSAAREYYRARFWELARRDPASVLVVSNQSPLDENTYTRLRFWPQFESYLQQNYLLVTERTFPHERYMLYSDALRVPAEADSYRLYVRKGSPLLGRVAGLNGGAGPAVAGAGP